MGGVGSHVAAISRRLSDRGHDVQVFAAGEQSQIQQRDGDEGVNVRRFRSISPGNAFHLTPGVASAIRDVNVDVVHAHNYHALVGLSALRGVSTERLVFTPHYHGRSASAFRNVLLKAYRPLGRRMLVGADAVIAVSEWERRKLLADFGVEARVIPNGLDVNRFADADPIARDRRYLLCVGRLERYKGVQDVIRALPELPEYDLVVGGDGPYREQLEAIAKRTGVADQVEFRGYVPDEALPGLYAGADVFLSLSVFESYGMTVAEALAAGTPCVVRTKRALADWTEEPGVVGLDTTTPASVAAAVETLSGRRVDTELPNWEDVTTDVLDVYGG